jgi:hypothetical protein
MMATTLKFELDDRACGGGDDDVSRRLQFGRLGMPYVPDAVECAAAMEVGVCRFLGLRLKG